ncbi:MAG: hypothetical protein CBR30_00985 [Dictyoglomus sp. NZ13-RE01]|nr:MAG: hypothetical protein CBR30_00985 [Dictyoglomus sp. NZ13-RE01]
MRKLKLIDIILIILAIIILVIAFTNKAPNKSKKIESIKVEEDLNKESNNININDIEEPKEEPPKTLDTYEERVKKMYELLPLLIKDLTTQNPSSEVVAKKIKIRIYYANSQGDYVDTNFHKEPPGSGYIKRFENPLAELSEVIERPW